MVAADLGDDRRVAKGDRGDENAEANVLSFSGQPGQDGEGVGGVRRRVTSGEEVVTAGVGDEPLRLAPLGGCQLLVVGAPEVGLVHHRKLQDVPPNTQFYAGSSSVTQQRPGPNGS